MLKTPNNNVNIIPRLTGNAHVGCCSYGELHNMNIGNKNKAFLVLPSNKNGRLQTDSIHQIVVLKYPI